MLATKNSFSVSKTAVVVKLIASECKSYIKSLSIQRQIRKTADCVKQQRKFLKMEYLKYFYGKILGYDGDEGSYKPPAKLIAFGNVLLDTTAQLMDQKLLEEFNLTPDTRGELDAELIARISATASDGNDCPKNPGGSALNTARILNQLGTVSLFFGAIGEDEAGEVLKKLLHEQSLDTRLQHISDTPTGQCIALICNDKATLYANIGASSKFTVEHLKNEEQSPFLRPIERKQIIYIEGFFVPQREDVCDYIVSNYVRDRKRLALNLSAAYIVQQNAEQIIKLARTAYFIFGNQSEFDALIEAMGCQTEEEMANELLQQGRVVKIIVITNGAKGVKLITNFDNDEYAEPGNLNFNTFCAQRVEEVVDTTGAGDGFVAGFFHAWLQKRQLSECVRQAAELAAKVCTQTGCKLPEGFTSL